VALLTEEFITVAGDDLSRKWKARGSSGAARSEERWMGWGTTTALTIAGVSAAAAGDNPVAVTPLRVSNRDRWVRGMREVRWRPSSDSGCGAGAHWWCAASTAVEAKEDGALELSPMGNGKWGAGLGRR
jgi:hypothetical protein